MTYQFKAKLANKIVDSITFNLKITINGDDISITENATNPSSDNVKPLCLNDKDWKIVNFNGTPEWNKWTKNLSGEYNLDISTNSLAFELEEDSVLYQLSWLGK